MSSELKRIYDRRYFERHRERKRAMAIAYYRANRDLINERRRKKRAQEGEQLRKALQ